MELSPHQSEYGQEDRSSPWTSPSHAARIPDVPSARIPDVSAAHPVSAAFDRAGEPAGTVRSPHRPPTAARRPPAVLPWCGTGSIPLELPEQQGSISSHHTREIVPVLATCIDMTVAIIQMHIATTEAIESQARCRKNKRRRLDGTLPLRSHTTSQDRCSEEGNRNHKHAHVIFNLLACHIGIHAARWYVKLRSTCWFEEYLFKIYTPDMFYDILRMRRATFDKLVNDLRPFIQGQPTHWRQPIGVEKKVVVTLFKLMHGVCIPLVADRAALGKSTVHGILRQVCSAISNNFGHLIAWPAGRRIARVTSAFQSKQHFPNCIGAIHGSHVYIAAPPTALWRQTTGTASRHSSYCYKP